MDFLLYSLQKYQNYLVFVYFCLIFLSWKYWIKKRSIFISAMLIRIAAAFALVASAAYILTIIFYLLFPGYFDHGQPIVASISWLWMQGYDLYPNWTTGDIYGLVYGPVFFLINGIVLLLDPTIFTSKIPGVLSFVAALAVMFIVLKKQTSSNISALLLLASFLLLFAPFGIYAYWNRPEAFLTLISALALLAAVNLPILKAAVCVGVLAGLAAGIKIHGFIYGIPVALMVLASAKNAHERIIIAIIGCACALASALLPYLAKGASIVGYWHFLNVVLHHGWSASLFFHNLPFALVLMMPIIGISMCRKPVVDPVQYSLLVGLYMSVVIMTVIGANPGAGDYYLLPIIPFWIYGITGVLKSYDVRTNEIAAAVFICLGLAYGPRVFLYMRGLQGAYEAAAQSEPNKIAELVTFVESYPEAQFGISDDEHYSSYFYRVLSVFAGRALQVDFGVWMELEHAGVDEKYILRFIQDCNVPIWILPIGTPFATANNYNQLPLLTEEFRHTFSRNYQLIKIGQAYQVWECKSRQ